MTIHKPQAVYRQEDGELLGYVSEHENGWVASTIFGAPFGTASSQEEAESILRTNGMQLLAGTWEYLDPNSHQWLPCVIIEAAKDHVRVALMDEDGFYPDTSKTYAVTNPIADSLRKVT